MPRKRILKWLLLVSLFVVASSTVPETVLAQATGTGGVLQTTTPVMLVTGAVTLARFLIGILNFFAFFLLSLLELVMNPDFMFGMNADVGGVPNLNLMNMLREIWQITRDLVNIGFALALIVGAIMMIVTADGTKMQEHLKSFVIALVLVNFSWFIPRVIFDASQVLTYTVYQIPSLIGAGGCVRPPEEGDAGPQPCEVITQYRFLSDETAIPPSGTAEIGDVPDANGEFTSLIDGSSGWRCPFRPLVCYQRVPIDEADAEVRTPTRIFQGLVVNHARLQWLLETLPVEVDATLPPDAPLLDVLKVMASTIIKIIIILLIHIAIVFPLMAMVAAFFIRIPVIWVSIAFMPLVALGFAFPKLREGEYKDLFYAWQEHFLQAVFLPAKVAIPFVIGFIMLNAGAQLPPPAEFGAIPGLPLFVGVRDLWQFLWMGIALFIIWKYSFDALKSDKAGFMGHFTESIQGIGSGLGSLAAQAPLSVPFIPVPGRGSMSPLALSHGLDPRRASSIMRSTGERPTMDMLFGNRGNVGARPNEAAVKQVQGNTALTNTININHFNPAVATGTTNDVINARLNDAFTQLRTQFTSLATLRENEIIATLHASGAIDERRRDELQQLLIRMNRATNTANPAAPPAPAPPAPTTP